MEPKYSTSNRKKVLVEKKKKVTKKKEDLKSLGGIVGLKTGSLAPPNKKPKLIPMEVEDESASSEEDEAPAQTKKRKAPNVDLKTVEEPTRRLRSHQNVKKQKTDDTTYPENVVGHHMGTEVNSGDLNDAQKALKELIQKDLKANIEIKGTEPYQQKAKAFYDNLVAKGSNSMQNDEVVFTTEPFEYSKGQIKYRPSLAIGRMASSPIQGVKAGASTPAGQMEENDDQGHLVFEAGVNSKAENKINSPNNVIPENGVINKGLKKVFEIQASTFAKNNPKKIVATLHAPFYKGASGRPDQVLHMIAVNGIIVCAVTLENPVKKIGVSPYKF